VAVGFQRARQDSQQVWFVVYEQNLRHAGSTGSARLRKRQPEGGAFTRLAFDIDGSVISPDDAIADAGSQAGPLADRLGGEKGFEELVLDILRHPHAAVAHLGHHAISVSERTDSDVAGGVRGPLGSTIFSSIASMALLTRFTKTCSNRCGRPTPAADRGEIQFDRYLMDLQLMPQNFEHVPDGVVQVDPAACEFGLA